MRSPSTRSQLSVLTLQKAVNDVQSHIDSERVLFKALLRLRGAKCRQCQHFILADHTDGRCDLCDCVRTRQVSRKGRKVSELFDMEAS